MTGVPPDGLLTTPQAAAVLGVPAARIRRWLFDGKAVPAGDLPGAAPGGRVHLWALDELRPLAEAYHQNRRKVV